MNSPLAFAQSKVSGLVTDKAGEPLLGVNVFEKGTNNDAIPNVDAKFTINV